jgi:hypothetical protein
MATNNAVNTSLSGQTGTGSFAGSVSPSLTTPKIITSINDSADNIMVTMSPIPSAVNNLRFNNGATGNGPQLSAYSVTDANVELNLAAQAASGVNVVGALNGTQPFSIQNGSGMYQHTTIFAFADTAATRTVTFPDSNGTVAFSGGSGVITTASIAGTTQTAAVNTRYIVANAGATTITLPTTFAIGDVVIIKGLGAGGWILTAGAATTIRFGNTVTSSAGTLTSANQYDTVYVSGLVANTTWSVDYVLSTGLTVA